MTWQNILKRPMMNVGDGKLAPLSSTRSENITDFELNPEELMNKLNAYDLDVKILEHKVGEINPRIRHIIADKNGVSKEVFSQAARQSGEYIWRGLRMVTERPMGSGKVNELREKFPEYHVTQTKSNVSQDAEMSKKYPDATEYYFSPKPELRIIQRGKYPANPRKYGKNRRTMIQYKRYLEEGEKYGVLNPDETVNRDKFKKHLIDRIKDTDIKLSDYDGVDEALNQFIPKPNLRPKEEFQGTWVDEVRIIRNAKSTNKQLVLKQLSIIYEKQMIKLLDDEKTLNSLIGQFSGTAVSLDDLFSKYKEDVLSTLKNNITDAIVEARKESSWISKNKLSYRLGGRENKRWRQKRRKLGVTRGRLTPITKSWFNAILKDKQEKLPEELTEGANVSDVPLKDWFKKKPKKTKPADNTAGTKQTKLF